METVAGFPYWEIGFDEKAKPKPATAIEALLRELPGRDLTDLFFISHGWNSDRRTSRDMYERLLARVRTVLDGQPRQDGARVSIGAVGIIWPSMRWADEAVPSGGGAASLGGELSDRELVEQLKAVFPRAKQQKALDEMARLLEERPDDPAELARFQKLMRTLASGTEGARAEEDDGERALLEDDPQEVFERFAAASPAPRDSEGGVAGLGDIGSRLWEGAKNALRQATYWEMKGRAGVVGKDGLGPLIGRIHDQQPELRIHLVGHSFGARLVSFALAGLPMPSAVGKSPVKSLVLLQGAFSHFAFAQALPHDPARGGALAGMDQRVDGPVAICHSVHDAAVGKLYPLASLSAGQDAAAMEDRLYRWGAMGHDGAQAVGAAQAALGRVGQKYSFSSGKFLNLNGDAVVRMGGPPAGAHSDIFHPEIAWVMLSASGIPGEGSLPAGSPCRIRVNGLS